MFIGSCNFTATRAKLMLNFTSFFILFIIPGETSCSFKNICCKCIFRYYHSINLRQKFQKIWKISLGQLGDANQTFFQLQLSHSTWVFCEHSWKLCFFFSWPLELLQVPLFSIPHVLKPSVSYLDFFWNSLFTLLSGCIGWSP